MIEHSQSSAASYGLQRCFGPFSAEKVRTPTRKKISSKLILNFSPQKFQNVYAVAHQVLSPGYCIVIELCGPLVRVCLLRFTCNFRTTFRCLPNANELGCRRPYPYSTVFLVVRPRRPAGPRSVAGLDRAFEMRKKTHVHA